MTGSKHRRHRHIYLEGGVIGGETSFLRRGDRPGTTTTDYANVLLKAGIMHTDQIPEPPASALLGREPPETTSTSSSSPSSWLDNLEPPLISDSAYLPLRCIYEKAKEHMLHPGNVSIECVPTKGTCLLFYTRRPEGFEVDAASFHGGRGVRSGLKFTLQKFKEIPPEARISRDAAGEFVTRSQEGLSERIKQRWGGERILAA